MVKVFESKFHKGSLIERFSNTLLVGNGGQNKFKWFGDIYGADFNGSGLYLSAGNVHNMPLNDFTISCNFYQNALRADTGIMGKIGNSSTGYFIAIASGRLSCWLLSGGKYLYSFGSATYPISPNRMYNVIVKINRAANTVSIYLNGVEISYSNYSVTSGGFSPSDSITITNPLTFGFTGNNDTYPYFNGAIHYCSIFNHALTNAEIAFEANYAINLKGARNPKLGFIKSKPTDLGNQKDRGLIAAYNMIKNGTTLVDISGNRNNGAIVKCTSSKNGLLLSGIGSYITITPTDSINTFNSFSIATRIKTTDTDASLLDKRDSVVDGYALYIVGGYVHLRINEATRTSIGTVVNDGKLHDIVAMYDGTYITIYVDGVLDEAPTNVGSMNINTTANLILGYIYSLSSGTYNYNGEYDDLRIYNRVLTVQEIKDYHNSFIQPALVDNLSDAPADGSTIVPSRWIAGTGAYKVGEYIIQNRYMLNKDMNTSTGWTFGGLSNISGGTLNMTGNSTANNYAYAGLEYSGIIGRKYRITYEVVSNTLTGTVGLSSGGVSASDIANTVINLPTALGINSVDFITYRTGAKALFSFQLDTGVSGGTIKIDNVTLSELTSLPTITNGTKYIECTTNGTIAIPSNVAYGTWEFDWYKGNTADFIYVYIMSKSPSVGSQYRLELYTDEAIYFYGGATDSTIKMSSRVSYFANNTWYRIKITRSKVGVWAILIKGGLFIPTVGYDGRTLVDTTSGSGTNPFTDNINTVSNYFVVNSRVGSQFGNFVITDGVVA